MGSSLNTFDPWASTRGIRALPRPGYLDPFGKFMVKAIRAGAPCEGVHYVHAPGVAEAMAAWYLMTPEERALARFVYPS